MKDVKFFIIVTIVSTILTFSMTLIMFDSVDGLRKPWQQEGSIRGGIRG